MLLKSPWTVATEPKKSFKADRFELMEVEFDMLRLRDLIVEPFFQLLEAVSKGMVPEKVYDVRYSTIPLSGKR
jgi:hypothetical protein